jgi:serine/threonine protein kinase
MTLSAAAEFGQYRIGRKLGSGGMGEVYQATHVFLDREVALKTLHPGAVEEHFRRLIQEARAASKLDHPNIVKVYDVAETDGIAYIAMEYIDGVTLRQMMMQRPLRLREALQYAVQIARALAAAHDVGILHRDVKPANIMITSRNVIKVVDFGLAQRFDLPESSEEEEIATRTVDAVALPIRQGPIAGTLGYMSPEQIRGSSL